MRFTRFQRSALICSLFLVAGAHTVALRAQDDGANGPPKVLVIQREFTKPGKGWRPAREDRGGVYPRNGGRRREAAIPRPWWSLSGQSRALFFSGYPSLLPGRRRPRVWKATRHCRRRWIERMSRMVSLVGDELERVGASRRSER